jgi:hypothetical protein
VTIAHLPLGSFLPVRRAEGNSLSKSIPVALCNWGQISASTCPSSAIAQGYTPFRRLGWPPALISNATANDAVDLCDVLSSFSTGLQWIALLAASVVSYALLMMPGPRFAAANDFLP